MNKDKYDKMDPLSITESLGIKTFRKSSRHIWSNDEDNQLIQYLMNITGNKLIDIDAESIDWDLLASRLSKDGIRKPKDYKKRWTTSLDPNVKKGKWTREEDEQLIQAYEKFGASWQKVAASIRTRTMDQCAKRYTEVLDPKTKDRLDPWTKDEELLLIKQVGIHGTKWRTVASHFKNRPALTCRNRWRKIVLSVVKDKADPFIKSEVEKITKNSPGSLSSIGIQNGMGNTNMGINRNNNDNININNNGGNSNLINNTGSIDSPTLPSQSMRETKVSTEWKYNLLGNNTPEIEGTIKDEHLVQQLVNYAKQQNLEISIHQHIHHHYNPPPHPYSHINSQDFSLMYDHFDGNSVNSSTSGTTNGGSGHGTNVHGNNHGINAVGGNGTKSYFLEPEAQLNRFQHFNYLPPLTEVPKLTSSSSPKRPDSPGSLTPLTQAVHLAVEQELEKKRKNDHDEAKHEREADKRIKYDSEDEDGMDFWETIHNLGELSKNTKPVSTHHPLHNYTPSSTPAPQPFSHPDHPGVRSRSRSQSQPPSSMMDHPSQDPSQVSHHHTGEKGEFMSYDKMESKSTSSEEEHQTFVYENLLGNFGMIPFNPS